MFRNMARFACSALEAIKATLPKAKELRRVIEPLDHARQSLPSRTSVWRFAHLRDRDAVVKLFVRNRVRAMEPQRRCTRVLKMGFRQGDKRAHMAHGAGLTVRKWMKRHWLSIPSDR